MAKRSTKTASEAEPAVPAAETGAPKPAPKRRRAKTAAPAAAEPDAAMETAAEAPVDEAYAGLPPEIAAMLAAAAAAAPAEEPAASLFEGAEPFGLPAVLDLTAASALREALLAKRGTPLVLDGSGVERLGGQCLQILLSAKATWAADGQALGLSGASEALIRDLSILGIPAEALSTHETA